MVKISNMVDADVSLEEQCRQFSAILGLSEPVPEAVLKAALQNESYARNLLLSRESPEMLEQLLNKPLTAQSATRGFSNMELIGKAATALARWAKTGFSMVNLQVLERRESACLSCPNLRAPKGVLQSNVPSTGVSEKVGHRTGRQVCDLCGCNVSSKIRLPSEACPDIDPANSTQTRWGEALKDFHIKRAST